MLERKWKWNRKKVAIIGLYSDDIRETTVCSGWVYQALFCVSYISNGSL